MPNNEHILDTIPYGALGLVPMSNCATLGEKVNTYLVKWRRERQSEHKNNIAFKGFERNTYIVNAQNPRFGT